MGHAESDFAISFFAARTPDRLQPIFGDFMDVRGNCSRSV